MFAYYLESFQDFSSAIKSTSVLCVFAIESDDRNDKKWLLNRGFLKCGAMVVLNFCFLTHRGQ